MTKLSTILYVDDEAPMRQIAQLALQSVGGYDVILCESGHEAIPKIIDEQPNLILLDVMMPDMDGPATLKAIREEKTINTIPIIFMTAKTRPEEIETLTKLGAIGVISKPFDPMKLAEHVKEVWLKAIE